MTFIGQLDQRIVIQKLTRGADDGAAGYLPGTWSQVCEEWAKVEPGSGREYTAQDQTVHRVDYKITIRRRNDITAAMKVIWEGKELAIIGNPRQTSRGHWTEFSCQMGAPS